jgi:hypothetical protein
MLIYNTSDVTVDGRGTGVYVWNGSRWMFIAVSGSVQTPVTNITVRTQGDVTSIMSGFDLQCLADVLPSNATNKDVNWSVAPYAGTGTGTVNPTSGLFTGNVAGTVTVRATATDGSNVWGEKQITVSPASVPVTGISVTPNTPQTITAGQTVQFTANVIPTNADDQGVTWSISSGGTGGTVSQTGLFTGTVAGQYVVHAAPAGNPSVFADVPVQVTPLQITNSCDGCKSFAQNLSDSKTTYPYWSWNEYQGFCFITSKVSGSQTLFRRYKWDGNAYILDTTGQLTHNLHPCRGVR